MKVLVKKWGNSASVRIPASVMAAAALSLDQAVDVREEAGRIVIEPIREEHSISMTWWRASPMRTAMTRWIPARPADGNSGEAARIRAGCRGCGVAGVRSPGGS